MMHIILRGGPLTGEIHTVDPQRTTFRAQAETGRWVTYEGTGQADRVTGLRIFIYRLPSARAGPGREGSRRA
jgi:hypothetical protein